MTAGASERVVARWAALGGQGVEVRVVKASDGHAISGELFQDAAP